MGFLRKLMGQSDQPSWPAPGPITAWPAGQLQIAGYVPMVLFDPIERTVEVVGQGSYQGTLEAIAGGRTVNGARLPDHKAVLLPEPCPTRQDPRGTEELGPRRPARRPPRVRLWSTTPQRRHVRGRPPSEAPRQAL